jgi:ribonuclease HI
MADNAATEAISKHLPSATISLPDDLPICSPREGLEIAIANLNTKGDCDSFKEWLQLKSGNDRYSLLRSDSLIELVPVEVRAAIDNSLSPAEKSLLEKCLRWWCRGLTAQAALKKVRVDAEVATQIRAKKRQL